LNEGNPEPLLFACLIGFMYCTYECFRRERVRCWLGLERILKCGGACLFLSVPRFALCIHTNENVPGLIICPAGIGSHQVHAIALTLLQPHSSMPRSLRPSATYTAAPAASAYQRRPRPSPDRRNLYEVIFAALRVTRAPRLAAVVRILQRSGYSVLAHLFSFDPVSAQAHIFLILPPHSRDPVHWRMLSPCFTSHQEKFPAFLPTRSHTRQNDEVIPAVRSISRAQIRAIPPTCVDSR